MGKRIIKLLQFQLKNHFESLQGKEVDIVLKNNSTFHGHLLSIDESSVKLEDKRQSVHEISLKGIHEIIYDLHSEF